MLRKTNLFTTIKSGEEEKRFHEALYCIKGMLIKLSL